MCISKDSIYAFQTFKCFVQTSVCLYVINILFLLLAGYGPGGFEKIQAHEFFKPINWTDLVNLKVTPPFKPVCMLDNLAFNFDKEYTSKTPKGRSAVYLKK